MYLYAKFNQFLKLIYSRLKNKRLMLYNKDMTISNNQSIRNVNTFANQILPLAIEYLAYKVHLLKLP
jgi:hypothetical protein